MIIMYYELNDENQDELLDDISIDIMVSFEPIPQPEKDEFSDLTQVEQVI